MKFLTINIIFSQVLNFINNWKLYFVISIPLIISIFLDYFFFYNTEKSFSDHTLSFLLVMFGYVITSIKINRFVILEEKSPFYKVSISLIVKCFLLVLLLILILAGPIYLIKIIMDGTKELWDATMLDPSWFLFIAPIVGLIIVVIIAFFTTIFAYPIFGILFPKIAIGEKIIVKETFKQSKGFRLSMYLQVILLFATWLLVDTIYFALMHISNLLDQFEIYFFLLNDMFLDVPFFVLIMSCLSKTYLMSKEKNLTKVEK